MSDIVIGNDVEFGLLAGTLDQGQAYAARLARRTAHIAIYKRGPGGLHHL